MDFAEKITLELKKYLGSNNVRIVNYDDGYSIIEWVDDGLESSFEWNFTQSSLETLPLYFKNIVLNALTSGLYTHSINFFNTFSGKKCTEFFTCISDAILWGRTNICHFNMDIINHF